MADPEFRRDLYQGTAGYYDPFRVPYPPDLIDDLAGRAGTDGAGRLLDLACGTGQLGFALHARFAEVWAVDQEPEMIAVVRDKARAAGLTGFRALATEFADDLRRALHASQPDGLFRQTIIFACDLARRPG